MAAVRPEYCRLQNRHSRTGVGSELAFLASVEATGAALRERRHLLVAAVAGDHVRPHMGARSADLQFDPDPIRPARVRDYPGIFCIASGLATETVNPMGNCSRASYTDLRRLSCEDSCGGGLCHLRLLPFLFRIAA